MAEVEVRSAQREIDEEKPPTCSAAPQTEDLRTLQEPSNSNVGQALNHSHINLANFSSTAIQSRHRFPREFGIYHTNNFFNLDLAISNHADDPQILFYVSIQSGSSGKPNIILHSGAQASSAPLATAELTFVSRTVTFKIYDIPNSIFEAQGTMKFITNMKFVVQVPGRRHGEEFMWKGQELVNRRTGEVVASWTKPPFSLRKMGKMRFLAKDRSRLGERFELMAVISLLSIERKIRERYIGVD
ncbi:hypothetical protein EPUL_005581 [Erysiphe pulchra]|uniref:Uncharacterized protein n=1 Tax=Erysiphe pulchra TaxID=225359 RepID=A0A2S4PM39_9PEZI|nr:hypothetical protein EPUL_005581 [Erysiphe pulchra]